MNYKKYIGLNCPSKFRDKPEGCERNLGVVTLKSEHFAGGDSAEQKGNKSCVFVRGTAAECETRLDKNRCRTFNQNIQWIKLNGISDLMRKLENVRLYSCDNRSIAFINR